MDTSEAMLRVAAARVATLGTTTPDGRPHLVPITFALLHPGPGGQADTPVIVNAVDDKPKRTTRLQRLANLATHPFATVLIHHYEEDWNRLWWVRLGGSAEVLERDQTGAAALIAKYPHYQERVPAGPYIRINVESISHWTAAP